MTHSFRLGDAILKVEEDSAYAPDTWRADLLRALDGPSRAAVARTCQAGLAWLLSDSDEATLAVNIRGSAAESVPHLLSRLHAARRDLGQRRGAVTVALQQRGKVGADDTWWQVAITALGSEGGSGGQVTNLSVQVSHIPRALLSLAGTALPGLASLSLGWPQGDVEVTLPAPSALPHLKHLTIHRASVRDQAGLWAAVMQFLPRLQSLTITEQPDSAEDPSTEKPQWSVALFESAPVSQTLQSLAVPGVLEPWLAQALRRCAPQLLKLTVESVSEDEHNGEGEQGGAACSWTHLVLCKDSYIFMHSWFPVPAVGKLTIQSSKPVHVHFWLPFEETVASKLTSIEFDGLGKIELMARMNDPSSDQVQDLLAAIPNLLPWQSPTALLELSFFRWSPALQAAVSTVYNAGWHTLGLRRLSHLDQEVTTQPPSPFPSLRKVEFRDTITDTHLTTVLAHVPTVDMCAGTFALTAALPADAARPWRAIETPQHTKMAEWLTQAELLGGDPCWQHKGIILSLSADEVDAGEHHRLAERLRSVRVASIKELHLHPAANTSVHDEPRVFRALLLVIKALSCAGEALILDGWKATQELAAELRGLPTWPKLALCLKQPESPLPTHRRAGPLVQLLGLIPRSFTYVYIDRHAVRSEQELEALVLQAPADRTAQDPLSLVFGGWREEWMTDMRAIVLHADTYPHISIVYSSIRLWHLYYTTG